MSDTLTDTTAAGAEPGRPPIDLYREVHKGLRRALTELVAATSSLDVADEDEVASVRSLFGDVEMMLTTHHSHEDIGRLGELIAQHVDHADQRTIRDAHDALDAGLAGISGRLDRLASDRDAAELYDAVVEYVAAYLAHMNDEEHVVMPALADGADPEELEQIVMQIRMSVPPPDMCVFLRYMLPAMNPAERTTMLGGMKLGAPPEIFSMFWGAAEQALGEGDLATVAARIG